MGFEDFCGSVFWDDYLTWNTTHPDFSPCFQKTVLVWVPCGILWLFTPFQIRFILNHKDRYIPRTGLNTTKLISVLILIGCSITRLALTTEQSHRKDATIFPVDFVYPVIETLTLLLALILGVIHVRKGIHSSSLLLIFWLFKTVAGAITYASFMMKVYSEDSIFDVPSFIITSIEFPFTFAQLILACFADTVIHRKNEDRNPYPTTYASPVSMLTYSYFGSLAWKGFKRPLEKDDLWSLSESFRSETAFADFDQLLANAECKRRQNIVEVDEGTGRRSTSTKQPSIAQIVWQMVKWDFIRGILIKFVSDILMFASPLMLRQLINFVSSDEPTWKGVLYALTLFVCTSTGMMFMNVHYYKMQLIGIRTRAAVMSAIYRKALRMSSASKRLSTVGEIVTLMSVDAQRVMDIWQFLGHAFSMPIQVTIALILLWNLLGPSVIVGLIVIILLIPLNGVIAAITAKVQVKLMKRKDNRTKLMNEILGGMKILKLYAWEMPFFNEINKVRTDELKSLKHTLLLQAVSIFLFQCAPIMISLSTFATYVLSDPANVLDATTAFVSLSLFDIMRLPLSLVPMVLAIVVQTHVSVKRINKFMANEDLEPTSVTHDLEDDPVVIQEGTFSWSREDEPVLKSINIRVPQGQLIAVVGAVGAGKSSLISCLLGEMEKIQGYVNTQGSIAYVAQQAWIQNATLRNNIAFGKRLDIAQYEKVIEACALQPDFEILPAGDQTEIGEKGINLSGGQKQRVSLARSVYQNADVYLMDDPLSAVDAHVGKHIFEKVIGPKGLLNKKTRILVTHGIAFLPYVDSIVVMVDGSVSEIGSYKELLQAGGSFADFIMAYLKENEDIDEVEAEELLEIQEGVLNEIKDNDVKRRLSRGISRALSSDDDSATGDRVSPSLKRRKRLRSTTSESLTSVHDLKRDSKVQLGKLTQEEQMEVGKVEWAVYWQYIKAIGLWLFILIFTSIGLSWTSSVGANIWLSIWSNDQPLPDGSQDEGLRDIRLAVYGILGFGQAFFSLGGSLAHVWGTLKASKFLHNSMLLNILRCPMAFFDVTPLGRIVNRFSRDIDVTDLSIPTYLRPVLDCLFQIIGTVVVISIGTPFFLIAFIPLGIIYYFIQRLYIDTSRQLKRMESVSRSPIYSHFSETISGLATIRAYQVQDNFIQVLEHTIDENHSLFYPILTAKRWLGVRLEGVGDMVVLFASLFSVLARDELEPGVVGLSVSYALSMTFVLMWLVRNWTDLESNIVSVERINEYSQLETEAPWEMPDLAPRSSWPEKGHVEFQNYCIRYREGLDLVLKGISCDIHSGEKVGIVGRTGAGKSSLTLALFRIIEAAEGSISIDGVDISIMGLHDLRSRLTIIPQDPVLFCGSLRLNLDPFNMYSDNDVWRALELSHLKEFATRLPQGLLYDITEGGENLSVGQRQLVCLARALLRKTKVLVLDEATAAVDLETDDLIQATIRKEFSDCTVLTIAHRLNSVLDSDRVMVLDNGIIKEFNSPSILLEAKDSIFHSMAKDAGLA